MKDDILSSSNINELEPFLSYGTSCSMLNLHQLRKPAKVNANIHSFYKNKTIVIF